MIIYYCIAMNEPEMRFKSVFAASKDTELRMRIFDRPHFIMEWASWPFGEHARSRWSQGCDDPKALEREELSGNPGNSVDLLEFVELFREHGDVKVHPAAASMATYLSRSTYYTWIRRLYRYTCSRYTVDRCKGMRLQG